MISVNSFLKRYSIVVFLVFVNLMSVCASGAAREDFVGAWLSDEPTEWTTRILITPSGTTDLTIHGYGYCSPIDCDWGTITTEYTGNPFQAVYHFSFKDVYMTFELLSATQLYVTSFHDYHPDDPRTDVTVYEYFTLMTEPDLVIHRIELPGTVVDYGVYNWITFYVQNLGAEGVSGPLRARIVDRERNGEPVSDTGYFDLSYTSPIGIGEEVPHQFAVGHPGSSWTDGDYTFRLEVDYDDLIAEADETNNVSLITTITIMDEYQLRGVCRYIGYPIDFFTDLTPIAYLQQSGVIPGAEFRYYPETGRYAINGVPEDGTVFLNSYFMVDESNTHAPGNYYYTSSFDLSTMTPTERENHDLDYAMSIHMTRPWDNVQIDEGEPHQHQPGIIFEWEPVYGAADYLFAVSRYNAGGFIDRPIEVYQAETSYTAVLPVSNPGETYGALILARNAAGETIGRMHRKLPGGGYGFNYPFTVDYECYTLPVLRLFITDMTTKEVEGTVWHRYHTAVTNWQQVPDAMFEIAPDLAPCGSNTESSRTWVRFEDADGVILNNYCALDSAQDLNGLTFSLTEGEAVPETVRMVMDDRRCGILYESILVDTTYPCPIGDLDGNCFVDLNDFSLFAGTWLMEGSILE